MSRVYLSNTVQNPYTGQAIASASCRVKLRGTSTDATLYVSEVGGSNQTNPVPITNGVIPAWIDPGSYDLVITGTGLNYTQPFEANRGDNPYLPANQVTNTIIANNAVTTTKILDANVTMAKLAANAVIRTGTDSGKGTASGFPAGTAYRSSDVSGGTLYVTDGSSWLVAGKAVSPPIGIELLPTVALSGNTWSIPSSNGEFTSPGPNNGTRLQFDLTSFTQARLFTTWYNLSGVTVTAIIQYSANGGTSWAALDGASGPSTVVSSGTPTATSSWINLATAAQADVLLRVYGNAGSSPTQNPIHMQLQLK